MKRALAIIAIALLLLISGIIEAINVSSIINVLQTDVMHFETELHENRSDLSALENEVERIKDDWQQKELKLCLMFNHKDLSTITDALNRLHTNITLNDYDNALIEINLLKAYSENSIHVMGFNFQNIF